MYLGKIHPDICTLSEMETVYKLWFPNADPQAGPGPGESQESIVTMNVGEDGDDLKPKACSSVSVFSFQCFF
jgi:hypothetical protein